MPKRKQTGEFGEVGQKDLRRRKLLDIIRANKGSSAKHLFSKMLATGDYDTLQQKTMENDLAALELFGLISGDRQRVTPTKGS